MDGRMTIAAAIFCIGFVLGVFLGKSIENLNIYSKYCNQYNMEYNGDLESCVNKDRTEIKKIEWENK